MKAKNELIREATEQIQIVNEGLYSSNELDDLQELEERKLRGEI